MIRKAVSLCAALGWLCAFFPGDRVAAAEEDAPGVIFILDGSGSMWGKVEGRAKIEVAKEVLTRLVAELPETVLAGFAAYGHRRKADCEDIQMLVPMASGNRSQLASQINAINPKGKTPITGSLSMAAEQLREVEDESTVVLISDGEETCGGDPCRLVRDLLERGIKARVHVVGFDVGAEERAQLNCIAEAGNGKYYTAQNAVELNDALAEVQREVVALAEPPANAEAIFTAVKAGTEEPITGDVEWTFIRLATEDLTVIDDQGSELALPLSPGDYEVLVVAGDMTGEAPITVRGTGDESFQIALQRAQSARPFDAPDSAVAGTYLRFDWRGPNAPGDLIFITSPETANNRYLISNSHATKKGSPAALTAPARPGNYEIRYFSKNNATVLARAPLKVLPHNVTITAPPTVAAGTHIRFEWSGPKAPGDKIFIASPKMEHNRYSISNAHGTKQGAAAALTAPASPGRYEFRYFSANNATLLARFPLEVTEPDVTIEAPRSMGVGSVMEFAWSGPGAPGDLIFIAPPNMAKNKYFLSNYHGAKSGSPAKLTAPAKPGTYEIRYYSKNNATVLAKRALIVR